MIKKVALLSIGLILIIGVVSCADQHATEKQLAQEGANSWLELVDSENYGQAWDEAE